MNSKLIKASLAGVAAIAVAAGGTTFAAWSDFTTADDAAGAGYLKISLAERQGSGSTIQPFSLAPGQNKTQEFYLASADSGNTPDGVLTAFIENLADTEDGATCTTNSEAVAEGSPVDGTGAPTDNTACGSVGELSSEMRVQILASAPQTSPTSCPNTGIYGTTTPSGTGTLASQIGKTFQLGTLDPGQGVCVRVEMSLPSTATNAVQGDDVGWNWQFDLNQA